MSADIRTSIIVSLLLSPAIAYSASFDCAKAWHPVEKLICADDQLSRADEILSSRYKDALRFSTIQVELRRQQLEWLNNGRNVCHDIPCLARAYKDRVEQLEKVWPLARQSSLTREEIEGKVVDATSGTWTAAITVLTADGKNRKISYDNSVATRKGTLSDIVQRSTLHIVATCKGQDNCWADEITISQPAPAANQTISLPPAKGKLRLTITY